MPKTTAKTSKAAALVAAHKKEVIHRSFSGLVVSAPGQKTISVLVKRLQIHTKYRKQFTTTKKYSVHDEKNEARVGDSVVFEECRPISKNKRWRLVSIEKKA